jgi:hypothetical protein
MIRRLTAAILVAALVGFAPSSSALGSSTATYLDLGEQCVLTLDALPGTNFLVRAEQADGSYAIVWVGTIDIAPLSRILPDAGAVGNGQPQFVIQFWGPGGQETIAIQDTPDDGWYWW